MRATLRAATQFLRGGAGLSKRVAPAKARPVVAAGVATATVTAAASATLSSPSSAAGAPPMATAAAGTNNGSCTDRGAATATAGTTATTAAAATTPPAGPVGPVMRAVRASAAGAAFDTLLEIVEDCPQPVFDAADKKNKGLALVRVRACALAPGDVRVLTGQTREIQGPPAYPYVPGGDVCGVVEAVADGEDYVQVGDCVVAQFHQNWGGLAEYAVVKTKMCDRKPPGLTCAEAAATASSGAAAVQLARHIREGDRVLILGGSGGVGTFLVQLARLRGASFVAATTTQTELVRSLGAHRAIDYTAEDVWALPEYQDPAGQFDLVVDLAGGGWDRGVKAAATAGTPPIVKSAWQGGRFLTTVAGEKWFEAHSWWDALKIFVFPVLAKSLHTFVVGWNQPRYRFALALGVDKARSEFRELFARTEAGNVRVVLHGGRPVPLHLPAVQEAFRVQRSGHAHGKLVVQIAADDDGDNGSGGSAGDGNGGNGGSGAAANSGGGGEGTGGE